MYSVQVGEHAKMTRITPSPLVHETNTNQVTSVLCDALLDSLSLSLSVTRGQSGLQKRIKFFALQKVKLVVAALSSNSLSQSYKLSFFPYAIQICFKL